MVNVPPSIPPIIVVEWKKAAALTTEHGNDLDQVRQLQMYLDEVDWTSFYGSGEFRWNTSIEEAGV